MMQQKEIELNVDINNYKFFVKSNKNECQKLKCQVNLLLEHDV